VWHCLGSGSRGALHACHFYAGGKISVRCLVFLHCCCVSPGSHRNTLVRDAASRLVVSVAENLGPGRVLSGIRDITDRILVASAQFVLDSSQYTRFSSVLFSSVSFNVT